MRPYRRGPHTSAICECVCERMKERERQKTLSLSPSLSPSPSLSLSLSLSLVEICSNTAYEVIQAWATYVSKMPLVSADVSVCCSHTVSHLSSRMRVYLTATVAHTPTQPAQIRTREYIHTSNDTHTHIHNANTMHMYLTHLQKQRKHTHIQIHIYLQRVLG